MPDSLTALYRRYYGAVPRAMGSCGIRRLGIAFDAPPSDVLASGPPHEGGAQVTDLGILNAGVGAALTISTLAWYAVRSSHSVDTITVIVRHRDGVGNEYDFVPEPGAVQPMRLLVGSVQTCSLPT